MAAIFAPNQKSHSLDFDGMSPPLGKRIAKMTIRLNGGRFNEG